MSPAAEAGTLYIVAPRHASLFDLGIVAFHFICPINWRSEHTKKNACSSSSARNSFGRDRGTARVGVERVEPVRQPRQRRSHRCRSPAAYDLWEAAVRPHVAEQSLLLVVRAAHRVLGSLPTQGIDTSASRQRVVQQRAKNVGKQVFLWIAGVAIEHMKIGLAKFVCSKSGHLQRSRCARGNESLC